MSASPYQKLPGRGVTWSGPARVWLGNDHVLLVLGRGYVENYRRFFFNDIQGILLRRTRIGILWNLIWGGLAGFFLLIALAVGDETARWIMVGLAAPFGLALLVNFFLGPTCTCHVRTAVQTERVPAISRVRDADKFIARVEPLIAAAQGTMPPEQIASEWARLPSGQPTAVATAAPSEAPPVVS